MRICATTLLGPGSGPKLGDAFDSVRDLVDAFVVVDGGGGEDASRAAHAAQGNTTLVEAGRIDWLGDYGAARQYALDAARRHGFDWAVTLDPDERLQLGPPETVRAALARYPDIEVWEAKHAVETYAKERIIRCACDGRWVGRSCEYFDRRGKTGCMGTFSELPHSPEHLTDRFRRGVENMLVQVELDPENPRWVRHLATCFRGLGQTDDALCHMQKAFEMFRRLGYAEHGSWAAFQIAEMLVEQGHLEQAEGYAAEGLAMHAGLLPEHASILAYCECKLGDAAGDKGIRQSKLQNAVRWAQLALSMPQDRTRRYFVSPYARKNAEDVLYGLCPERRVTMPFAGTASGACG